MGPGVANECVETKDGPVLWEDHFYPEIIDPVTGEVLPDGERGELVLTSLTKEAFPVIRYRTRDLTALLPPTARSMRRLARISARSDDMLIIRGVNLYPSQIEELLLAEASLSAHWQLEVNRPHMMDELTVLVEGAAHAITEEVSAAAASLQRRMKTMIGLTAHVRIVATGGIERSIGKAKRVVDRRQ